MGPLPVHIITGPLWANVEQTSCQDTLEVILCKYSQHFAWARVSMTPANLLKVTKACHQQWLWRACWSFFLKMPLPRPGFPFCRLVSPLAEGGKKHAGHVETAGKSGTKTNEPQKGS